MIRFTKEPHPYPDEQSNEMEIQMYLNALLNSLLETSVGNYDGIVPEKVQSLASVIFSEEFQKMEPAKCLQIIHELYEWSNDPYEHPCSPMHADALRGYLTILYAVQENIPDVFRQVYFENAMDVVYALSQIASDTESIPINEAVENYCRIETYFPLFLPSDSTATEDDQRSQEEAIAPSWVHFRGQEQIGARTLADFMLDFVLFLQQQLRSPEGSTLVWDGNKPVSEDKLGELLTELLKAYFHGVRLDIRKNENQKEFVELTVEDFEYWMGTLHIRVSCAEDGISDIEAERQYFENVRAGTHPLQSYLWFFFAFSHKAVEAFETLLTELDCEPGMRATAVLFDCSSQDLCG